LAIVAFAADDELSEGAMADELVMSDAADIIEDDDMVDELVMAEASVAADEDDWAIAPVASTAVRAVPAKSRRIIGFSIWGARGGR
jgi:hypothetical protein